MFYMQKRKELNQFYRSKREKDGVEYQCKECAKNRQKEQRKKNFQKILDHYGARCFCCGETIKEFLTIDHVNRDGAEHRRQLNRGRLYASIIRDGFPNRFRIACANCNFSLGMKGYCPHKK